MEKHKSILIVGANFDNKGAQSMLFVTVDEILKRVPDANIFFASTDKYDAGAYQFKRVYYSNLSKKNLLGKSSVLLILKDMIKATIKRISGKGMDGPFSFQQIKYLISEINLIIDISGFNIGEKWRTDIQEAYLDNIRIAKKYHIPIALMPQSFGPFHYSKDQQYILQEIKELFPYASIIFAREKEGYMLLTETLGLHNTELSSDLVLQNRGIDLCHLFKKPKEVIVPQVEKNAVGIVPNNQCISHGNKEKILRLYHRIIAHLVNENKKVYIFRHSYGDLDICKEIYYFVSGLGDIRLIENDLSCIEYESFVKQFDFIVCSRYHGIVHAYRKDVPCIILGWAMKYNELAESLQQGKYCFDITDPELQDAEVEKAIEIICREKDNEKAMIQARLEQIQRDNCFDRAFASLEQL